jgi:hypothetical protein
MTNTFFLKDLLTLRFHRAFKEERSRIYIALITLFFANLTSDKLFESLQRPKTYQKAAELAWNDLDADVMAIFVYY